MSSLVNCPNQSTSAPISESDNDNENVFDSSLHKQNESMMHKVKDVVSKFLHPSFLFSNNDDTDRSKRKRSTSTEEEQTTTITTDTTNGHTTTSRSRYGRPMVRDDEPQLTDDEDSNSRDVPSTDPDSTEIEQQKKRRRTANYQHILLTDGHDDDERTASPLTSTDSVRSQSNRRIDQSSLITQTPNERTNRFTPAKQRFDILPTYRGSPTSYDPTKSPLFSTGNRKTTTTNLKSDEFSANYLLASGLVSRPQSSSSRSQQSPATLTNPTSTTRQMFGVNYSSINSRRLPYIERLRRRTLHDCIRLNRTVDSEPLSESVIEEHRSTTTSPVPKRIKAPDKDCGIQCDISILESSIESSKKHQRTFPPADIRNEALTIPPVEKSQSSSQTDSPIQTNSSITIEQAQPKFDITKPKVLGNVTPFSWPKFARAQEEYARKYPEKCRTDAVVPAKSVPPSNVGSSNASIIPTMPPQTIASTMPKLPLFSFSTPRPTGDIWKCPSCTKEHPAQTASCSLCRQINPNYKKPSATEPTVTPAKEPVSSSKLPDVVAKEPSAPTPVTNSTTITKESVLPAAPIITIPLFGVTPSTSLSVTSKDSTTTTTFPMFGVTASTSSPVTTKESTTSITAPVTTSSFSTSPIVSTVKETPTTTSSSTTPLLNATPIVSSPPATTQDTPVSTSATSLSFSVAPAIVTTKENPVTTSSSIMFGTTAAAFDKTLPISVNSPFPSDRPFQPFLPVTSASPATAVTTFTVPSFTTITPSLPTTTSFGTFGSTSAAVPPATTTTVPFGTFGSTSAAPPTTMTTVPFGTFGSTSAAPPTTTTTVPFGTFSSTSAAPPTTATTTPFGTFGSTSAAPPTTVTTAPFGTFGSTSAAPSTTATITPFGTFGSTPAAPPTTTTAAAAAAPVVSTVSSVQVPAFTFTPSTSTLSLPTTTTTSSTLFGLSSAVPAPTVSTPALSFPTPSIATTSTSTSSSSFTLPATSTPFGSGAFGSTTSNPPFAFGAGTFPQSSAPTVPAFGTVPPFGASTSFGITPAPVDRSASSISPFGASTSFGIAPTPVEKSASSDSPFGGSSTTAPFGFGSSLSTAQTSAPAIPTGGFAFSSPALAIPVFGAGPPPLSSGGSSSPFVFSGTPAAASTTSAPFQFSGVPTLPSNPFVTATPSDSNDTPNPFSINETEPSSTGGPRRKLRAMRRIP